MVRTVGVLLAVFSLHVSAAHAAKCETTVRVDHRARTVEVVRGAKVREIRDWNKPIKLETKETVCFEVVNTSTGAYRFEVVDTPIDAAGLAGLLTFAKATAPYALDLGKQAAEGGEFVARAGLAPEVKKALADLTATLEALPVLVRGPYGVEDTLFKAAAAIQSMSLDPAGSARIGTALRKELEPRFECADGATAADCAKQLTVVRLVTEKYLAADVAAGVLESALPSVEAEDMKEAIGALLAQWFEWRARFTLVVAAARRAEELAKTAMDSKTEWTSKSFHATWRTGHELTLKISLRDDPELAVFGGRQAMKVVVRVMPKHSVHFTAGAAFLGAPEAKYATYGTANQGSPTIVRAGYVDQRFFWALSLAAGLDVLDWREQNNLALWIPELVLSPGPERAMGIGSGVSWKRLRLSGGALWVRHSQLENGQHLGDPLAPGEVLRTSEGYDFARPDWYFAASLNY